MLLKFFVELFANGLDGKIDRQPYGEVDRDENRGEDQYHVPLEGDPGIDQITADVGGIDGAQMEKDRSCGRPAVDLIEDACARLYESQDIGGQNGEEDLRARECKVGQGEGQRQ